MAEPAPFPPESYPSHPVAALHLVLAALQDPVRLEMVRRLRNAQAPLQCSALYDGINKSTATHHFKILREAGVTERLVLGGLTHQRLRADELDAALPGLLASVVDGANREAAAR
ncbi:DNA-binding transcriptional ArsR family regulator [Mycolicibacterium sp. BK556]|uniref:ArsR/SmtB family transcription factor n=1 Tax=Mycobacteriaceae TaxID=1762 RepID=UPI0010D7F346|nr:MULTISPECIES: helix-turn-helix domain-containing protein [Mycobacteriaceae]MBB3600776.1 DNA-binding transcriptional ArsR family regulator [Mycolicibacterium sp. BK556]MBB3630530.1 DNA-binding transcriptional ArsR family regulator [Mycolicibacterium sp. BK607]MBB3748521.1 DNA-binding transcriptional ArsR family regulator [Mycolicibacterium sp. BK634]TDO10317.1 DNA-binding transcriptional ArsR family regulator [Mycobacterium sp. BK086]